MSASNTNTWTPQQKKIVFNGRNWKYKIYGQASVWTRGKTKQLPTCRFLRIGSEKATEMLLHKAKHHRNHSAPTGIPNRSLSFTLFPINWLEEDMEAELKYWYQMNMLLSWIHFLLGFLFVFSGFLIEGFCCFLCFLFFNYLNVVKSILILSKAWHCLHKTKCKTLTSVFPPWPQRIEPTHPTPVLTTLIMFNKAAVL